MVFITVLQKGIDWMHFYYQVNQKVFHLEKINVMVVIIDNLKEVENEMLDTQTVKNTAEMQKGTEVQEQKEVQLHKMLVKE